MTAQGPFQPILLAAPHRLPFLGGIIQFALAIALWLWVLASWYVSAIPVVPLVVPGIAAHAFVMLYGLFPFFVFGFALTAFPRWVGSLALSRARYSTISTCLLLGMPLVYAGFLLNRELAGIGSLIMVLGWALGVFSLLQAWWRSDRDKDRRFAIFPLLFISAGGLGCAVYALWLFFDQPQLLQAAQTLGLWLFLVPLIVAISYRMLPFFSSRVLSDYPIVKPVWTLPATLLLVVLHSLLELGQYEAWLFISDLPLAGLAAWHTYLWQPIRSLRVPLLGMLHIAFAWLSVAMLLYGLDSLLLLTGAQITLGTAPLHALGIGYIASMTLAMATRVSRGHSGRPLIAGPLALWAFGLLQLTAALRLVSDLPAMAAIRPWWLLAAGLVWLLGLLPWSVIYAGVVSRPRVDGKAG